MNTQEQSVSEEIHEDGVEHGPIFFTVFDPEGKIRNHGECCACDLHRFDLSNFPKGAYITALEYNEDIRH